MNQGRLGNVARRWLDRRLAVLLALLLVALVVHAAWTTLARRGPFNKLGNDFLLYLTQATVLHEHGPAAIYDGHHMQETMERLLRPSHPPVPTHSTVVPYPPLVAWLLQPFVGWPPSFALLLWTALNLLAAVWLGLRCARLLPDGSRTLVVLLVLVAYPVTLTLLLGQIQLWLACAVAEAYLALQRGRPLRAGLWLGLLVIKPQYLLLLVPVLLWTRRPTILTGLALSAAGIWGGSLRLVGIDGVRHYPEAFGTMLPLRSDWPQAMVNWRGLVLALRPDSGDRFVWAMTLAMTFATLLAVWYACRDGWQPDRTDFPAKLTVLLIATLLVTYHSHSYGAALLAAPLAAIWKTPAATRLVRAVILVGAFAPTVLLCASYPLSLTDLAVFSRVRYAAPLTALALIGLGALLLADLLQRRAPETVPSAISAHAAPLRDRHAR